MANSSIASQWAPQPESVRTTAAMRFCQPWAIKWIMAQSGDAGGAAGSGGANFALKPRGRKCNGGGFGGPQPASHKGDTPDLPARRLQIWGRWCRGVGCLAGLVYSWAVARGVDTWYFNRCRAKPQALSADLNSTSRPPLPLCSTDYHLKYFSMLNCMSP